MNLETGAWDDELLRIFDVPRAMLPRIAPSSGVVGVIAAEHFGAEIPIAGHRRRPAGGAGRTGLLPRGTLQKHLWHRMFRADAHRRAPAAFAPIACWATRAASIGERNRNSPSKAAYSWRERPCSGCATSWALIQTAAESEPLAARSPDTGGVYLVPAFVGLGAPHWDAGARGIICGLTRSSGRAHIVRASARKHRLPDPRTDRRHAGRRGRNASPNCAWTAARRRTISSCSSRPTSWDCPIVRPADIETTALGAAYLAGLATGFWKSVGRGGELLARRTTLRAGHGRRPLATAVLRAGRTPWPAAERRDHSRP